MKIITFDNIEQLHINPDTCLRWVTEMIENKKKTQLPPKISMHLADGVFCNVMPCIIPGNVAEKWGGVKVVNRYPDRKPSLDSKLLLESAEKGHSESGEKGHFQSIDLGH